MDILKRIVSSLPKNLSDIFALLFLIIAVISTFLFEVLVVLPHIHGIDVTIQYFHSLNGLFILFNIISNLLMVIITDNSTSGLMLPSVLKPNWRFCPSCEANSPPRSHHCHICDKCILKRDHHCVFSG
jgi:palmitoyltransferase